MRLSRRWVAVGAGLIVALVVTAGCGSSAEKSTPEPPGTTSASSATASPMSIESSGPVVTVPALPGSTGGAVTSTPGPRSSSRTAKPSGSAVSPRQPATSIRPTSTPAASTPADRVPATSAPVATPTRPATTAASSTTATTPTIRLSSCPGCTVLAYEPAVTGGYGAVLARSANGRGLLLTVAPDGSTRSGVNIPYGATFKAPFGGVLPCDDDGFCIVIAATPQGKAIASAFRMLPSGSWQDVSGEDGFPSDTADARAVDLDADGRFEIATQIDGPTGPLWLVNRWSGSAFTVLGCGPGVDPPAAAALTAAACEG